MRNKGFTLLEIAIVLVVVGLLISGILAAQNLISGAQKIRVVREAAQFGIAVKKFRKMYRYLPGDFPAAADSFTNASIPGLNTINGDGNNFVTEGDDVSDATKYESVKAMEHMRLSGMLTMKEPSESGYIVGGGYGIYPSAAYSRAAYMLLSDSSGFKGRIFAPSSTSARKGFIKPADLLAIDIKVDDGRAGSGNLRGLNQENAAPANCLSAGNYDTGVDDKSCIADYYM